MSFFYAGVRSAALAHRLEENPKDVVGERVSLSYGMDWFFSYR